MADENRWKINDTKDGMMVIDLLSWQYFNDFICQKMLDYRYYIWRGQRDVSWPLLSTLDRELIKRKKSNDKTIRETHLERFKFACRGRRGNNPVPLETDNDWWALGQHHGLATPLLDWTKSPFVAAYFAFEEESKRATERRAVFGIIKPEIKSKSEEISKDWKYSERAPIVEFIEPLSDENPRLVNQGGLFTRAPDGMDLESWVKESFQGEKKNIYLMKVTIPGEDRGLCLRSLNRMNINHLSLFPDLFGSSKFVNLDLKIDIY